MGIRLLGLADSEVGGLQGERERGVGDAIMNRPPHEAVFLEYTEY